MRRNFSWAVVGNVVYAACQWALVAILAKIGTPEMVGVYALALAISTPIAEFSRMNLRAVQATDATRTFAFAEYLSFRAISTALALGATTFIAFSGDRSGNAARVLFLVGMVKALESVSDVFDGEFLRRRRMDIIAKVKLSNGVLSLVLMLAVVWRTNSLLAGSVGLLVAALLPLVILTIPNYMFMLSEEESNTGRFRWSLSRSRELFVISLPLGVVMLLVSLSTNVPRYAIEHYLSTRELGVFAALVFLAIAPSVLVNSLGQSMTPHLATLYADNQFEKFARLCLMMMLAGLGLGTCFGVVALVSGKSLITLVYAREYAEYVSVFAVLAFGSGFSYAASLAGYGVTAAREFRAQVPINLIVVAGTALLCVVLVPRYMLNGAAFSVLIMNLAKLSLYMVILARSMRRSMSCQT